LLCPQDVTLVSVTDALLDVKPEQSFCSSSWQAAAFSDAVVTWEYSSWQFARLSPETPWDDAEREGIAEYW